MTAAVRPVVGVDGCRGGWLAVAMPPGSPEGAAARIMPEVRGLAEGAHAVAVDIPIGLMDRPEDGRRPADLAARAYLSALNVDGVRGVGSRVFAAPSRAHLDLWRTGATYAALRAAFPPPRSLSKQCWNICDRIAELDDLLRGRPDLPIRESHPEVAFARRAGQTLAPKKGLQGRAAREALLTGAGFDLPALATALPARTSAWAWDDLLDACVLALVAEGILSGTALVLPAPAERDSLGLPRVIAA